MVLAWSSSRTRFASTCRLRICPISSARPPARPAQTGYPSGEELEGIRQKGPIKQLAFTTDHPQLSEKENPTTTRSRAHGASRPCPDLSRPLSPRRNLVTRMPPGFDPTASPHLRRESSQQRTTEARGPPHALDENMQGPASRRWTATGAGARRPARPARHGRPPSSTKAPRAQGSGGRDGRPPRGRRQLGNPHIPLDAASAPPVARGRESSVRWEVDRTRR